MLFRVPTLRLCLASFAIEWLGVAGGHESIGAPCSKLVPKASGK